MEEDYGSRETSRRGSRRQVSRRKIFEMRRIGEELYYLQATRLSIRSNVTNQDKPCGICLERCKAMIETCQIRPSVKTKRGEEKKMQGILRTDNTRTKGQLMGKDKYGSSLCSHP